MLARTASSVLPSARRFEDASRGWREGSVTASRLRRLVHVCFGLVRGLLLLVDRCRRIRIRLRHAVGIDAVGCRRAPRNSVLALLFGELLEPFVHLGLEVV